MHKLISVIGKIALSAALSVIAILMIHLVWDVYDDYDTRRRLGIWLANKFLLLVGVVLSTATAMGAWVAVGYVWMKKK